MMNFKAGKSINHQSYNYFMPNDINKPWVIDDMEIISLSKADMELGRLDTYIEYVNVDLFISMHIAKEASQSSRIELVRGKTYVFREYLRLFDNRS